MIEHDGCKNCKYEDGSNYFPCNKCCYGDDDSGDDMFVGNPVNHPAHYTSGKIEVWDFIKDQKMDYDRGCAIKYICRAGKKDPAKEIEDLEKAVACIQHEIKGLKND